MVRFEQPDHVIASAVLNLQSGRFEGYIHELDIHQHYRMPANQAFASKMLSSTCWLAVMDTRHGTARAVGKGDIHDLDAEDSGIWYVAFDLPGTTLPQSIMDEIEHDELYDPNAHAPPDTEHVTQLVGHKLQLELKLAQQASGDFELTSFGAYAEPILTYATLPSQAVLDSLAQIGCGPVSHFNYWNQSERQLHLTDGMLACCLGELVG